MRAIWLRTFTVFTGGDASRDSLYRALRDVEGAGEILPSPDAAGRAWREYRACVQQVLDAGSDVNVAEVSSGSMHMKRADWTDEWFQGIQQKYRPTAEVHKGFPIGKGPPRVQLAGALHEKWGVMVSRKHVLAELLALGFDSIPNAWLVPLFKELSEVAKKWGELLWPKYWMDFVGFEAFFGAPPVKGADFAPQLEAWVFTPKPEDGKGSDRRRVVEEGLREVARRQFTFEEQLSVDEFLRSPSKWLANGASTGVRLEGSKGTKFSTYLASSREELLADLMSTAAPKNVVNPKRERTKTRNTISSDWDLYLQMKYLCQGVENAMESVFPTTLGNKLPQIARWNMWRRKLGKSIGVPIDQSTFDHVPWMEIIISMIRMLCESARRKSPEPEFHARLTEILIERIRKGTVNWEGHSWRHVRGLLSGWALTSALGTLMNFIELVGIVVVTRGTMPQLDELCLQGDDDLIFSNSWAAAVTLVKTYMRVLPVNPGKFFISSQRTEFLRMVITTDRVTGYAARAIPSLYYANAWAGGKMSVQSTVSSWSRLVQRGCDPALVREHAIRDVAGFVRAPRKHIEDLLATPKAVGGLGMEVRAGGKWRCVDESAIREDGPFETRRVAATDPDRVPPKVRRVAVASMQSHGGHLRDYDHAAGAAEAVLAGVQGQSWSAELDSKVSIKPVAVRSVPGLLTGHFVDVSPPKVVIDAMFLAPVLRRLLKRGWEAVSELFHPSDKARVRARWSAWSRGVWFDWVCGRLKPKGWADWRMGSVVASAVSSAVGYQLWTPRGKLTNDTVAAGMIATEAHSRRYHAEDLVWMGG